MRSVDSSTSSTPAGAARARPGGGRAGRAVGGLLLLVVGGAVIWQAGLAASGFGVLFGVLLAGVGLLAFAQLGLEGGGHGDGVVTTTSPDGEPATFLPRKGAVPLLSALALLLLAGYLLGTAWVAADDGQAVLAVIAAVLGLPLAVYLGFVAAGRMPAGGVYLTPTRVVDVASGSTVGVRWDDIVGVTVDRQVALRLTAGGTVDTARSSPPGWRGGAKHRDGALVVDGRYLREDAAVLAFLLEAYRQRSDLRTQLGTPESLRWEILRT
jgi:hypothetical protein